MMKNVIRYHTMNERYHSVLTLFCRFMLEWLSFAYRYVPFGLQKYPPQVKATLFCQACVVKIEPEFGHLLTGTPNKLNQYVFCP